MAAGNSILHARRQDTVGPSGVESGVGLTWISLPAYLSGRIFFPGFLNVIFKNGFTMLCLFIYFFFSWEHCFVATKKIRFLSLKNGFCRESGTDGTPFEVPSGKIERIIFSQHKNTEKTVKKRQNISFFFQNSRSNNTEFFGQKRRHDMFW